MWVSGAIRQQQKLKTQKNMSTATMETGDMKTAAELLEWAVKGSNCLMMFNPKSLPMAAKAKINANIVRGDYDPHLTEKQIDILEFSIGVVSPVWKSPREHECQYFVYADKSILFVSNSQDEAWADVNDFVAQRITPYVDDGREMDDMDTALTNYISSL